MSVVINGMTVPLACSACPFLAEDDTYGDHCVVGWKKLPLEEDKPSWCPLSPLPEKHGRLVDVDAIIERLTRPEPRNTSGHNTKLTFKELCDPCVSREPVYPLTFKEVFDAFILELQHEPSVIDAEV